MAIKPTDSLDTSSGWGVIDDAEGVQPVIPDESVGWGHVGEAYQVAGLGSGIARGLGRALRRAPKTRPDVNLGSSISDEEKALVDKVLRDIRNKEIPEGRRARKGDIEAAEQGGEPPVPIAPGAPTPRAKMGESGEINLERHHPGAMQQDYVRLSELALDDPGKILKMVQGAEDFADALDAIGRGLKEAPRTHASIRASGIDWTNLQKGVESGGLLNDRQLFAARTIVATLGDKTVTLAKKIYQGDHTPQTLLEYEQVGQQLIALTKYTKGQTREVARALSQQNMIADTLAGNDLQALDQAITRSSGGDSQALINNAKSIVNALNSGANVSSAVAAALDKRSPLQAGIEFWKANLLSSPVTHSVNVGSAIITTGYEAMLRGVAAGFSETRQALGLGSTVDRVYFAEGGERLLGAYTGTVKGLQSIARIFMDPNYNGEFAMGTRADVSQVGQVSSYAATGFEKLGLSPDAGAQVGHAATASLRVMRMEDELFKSIAYHSELAGLAMRDGLNLGLEGTALTKHVDDLVMHPTSTMDEQAYRVASTVTFQDQDLGGLIGLTAQSLTRLTKEYPALQFILPFISTPANIIHYVAENTVSPLTKRWREDFMAGGARADMAMARFVTGMAAMGTIYGFYNAGHITGSGPDNKEQRAALERTGWKPNAVMLEIDGEIKFFTYDRLDPFGLAIGSVADAMDKARFARREQDALNLFLDAGLSLGENVLSHSFLQGLNQFIEVFMSSERAGPAAVKFGANLLSGFVPYSSALAAVARSTEDETRAMSVPPRLGMGGKGTFSDIAGIAGDVLSSRLPGKRDAMRPKRYWDGSVVVPEASTAARLISPVQVGTFKDDNASIELATNAVSVSEPNPFFSVPGVQGVQFNLLDFDGGKGMVYDAYLKDVGELRREAVESTLGDMSYDALGKGVESQRTLALEKAIAAGTEAGKRKFLGETLPMLLVKEGEQLKRVAQELGVDPEALLSSIKEGSLQPQHDLRFNERGAAGNKRQVPLVPKLGF